MVNNLMQFKYDNLNQLETAWNGMSDNAKSVYTPNYHAGRNSGFTHFIASQYAAHTSKELDTYK